MNKLKKIDIVYVVKNSSNNEELKYSLRSVVKNFPYHKIWFYGGKPDNLNPDHYVELKPDGTVKYNRVHYLITEICKNDNITEDFILFNDDFFVLQKIKELPVYIGGNLQGLINRIEFRFGRITAYTSILKKAQNALIDNGKTTFNFELHIPMLFNRKKLLEVINKYPGMYGIRSLYGNETYSPNDLFVRSDVKMWSGNEIMVLNDFVSTADSIVNNPSFKQITNKFRKPSKYEQL